MAATHLLRSLRRPSGRRRGWLAVALALAIALRLLVPEGWMPSAQGGLMLCDGRMPVAQAMSSMPHGHGKHQAPAGQRQDHPCAFAVAGAVATPPLPVVLPLPASAVHADAVAARHVVAVGRGLAAPPPPATGPPAFA